MYLNAYVPGLQYESGVAAFFRRHRGQPFASSALMDRSARPSWPPFTRSCRSTGRRSHVREGAAEGRRDGGALEALPGAGGRRVRGPGPGEDGGAPDREAPQPNDRPGLFRARPVDRLVNHFYFYAVDRDFGPFFLKFGTYFPYNAKLCLNGHEYVKRQLPSPGSSTRPWTTAFSRVPTPGGCKRSVKDSRRRRSRRSLTRAAPAAAPVHRVGSAGGLPLSPVHLAGRVQSHAGVGPPRLRPRLLRGGDPEAMMGGRPAGRA